MGDVSPTSHQRWTSSLPLVTAAVVVVGALTYLRLAGRVWWCTCGTPTLFSAEVASRHNSQHLFDWYSFSHVLHGAIFYWGLRLAAPRLGLAWKVMVAVVVETAWEVLENSPFIIDRYREATAALGYEGDSVVNIVGDLLFCLAGFFAARAIGWRWSIAFFAAVELTMLAMIRDNLTLNVVMLVWPVESIRQWQMGA